MATAYDTFSTASSSFGTTLTWTHTPVGVPTLVLMGITFNDANATTATVPTYGATAMTLVAGPIRSGNAGLYVYKLENPPSGAQSASYTLNESGKRRTGSVMSFTGTVLSSALRTAATATGSSTAPSVAVTTVAGDLTIDFVTQAFAAIAPTLTAGADQTKRFQIDSGEVTTNTSGAGSTEAAVGVSTTMSWSSTLNNDWSIVGVGLIEATLQNAAATVTIAVTTTAAATLRVDAAVTVAIGVTTTAAATASSVATAAASATIGVVTTATAAAGMFADPVIAGTTAGSPYINPYSVATFGSGTPPTVWLALQLIAIGTGSGGLEVPFSAGYSRQPITNTLSVSGWTTISGGVQQTAMVEFDEATAAWGTIVGWSLRDAATGGNVLAFGLFGRPQAVGVDVRFMVAERNLTLLAAYATATGVVAEVVTQTVSATSTANTNEWRSLGVKTGWTGHAGWDEGTEWGRCTTCDRTVPVGELRYNRRYGWQCLHGIYGQGCYDGPIQRDELLRLPWPNEGARRSPSPARPSDDDDWTL